MNEADLRDQIVETGAALYARGYTHGSTGNISVALRSRLAADADQLVSGTARSGAALAHARADGRLISGDPPSKEAFLHLAIYQERTGLGAVVHLHATYSTAVSAACRRRSGRRAAAADRLLRHAYRTPAAGALSPAGRRRPGRGGAHCRPRVSRRAARQSRPGGGRRSGCRGDRSVEELEETAKLFLILRGSKVRLLTDEQVAALNPS